MSTVERTKNPSNHFDRSIALMSQSPACVLVECNFDLTGSALSQVLNKRNIRVLCSEEGNHMIATKIIIKEKRKH